MRLAGQVKMGYYPTPEVVTDRIRGLLRFPREATASLVDPCAGEGLALARIAEGQGAVTYGVELDGERAREAKTRLDHALFCGIEEAVMTRQVASLLYLNPPYDYDEGRRVEERFLKRTYSVLQPGGVLVFVIPKSRLTDGIAKVLAHQFHQVRTWRFPDDEYALYKQIVVCAVRGAPGGLAEAKATQAALIEVRGVRDSEVPELPAEADAAEVYEVPACRGIPTFRSSRLSPEAAEELARTSPLWGRLDARLRPAEVGSVGRPPLPLHTGHLGLLIASGYLNGVVGEGANRHVVAGHQQKHYSEESEVDVDDEGRETEITRVKESYRISIKVLTQDGAIKTLV